jgi:hypothetical protein
MGTEMIKCPDTRSTSETQASLRRSLTKCRHSCRLDSNEAQSLEFERGAPDFTPGAVFSFTRPGLAYCSYCAYS